MFKNKHSTLKMSQNPTLIAVKFKHFIMVIKQN